MHFSAALVAATAIYFQGSSAHMFMKTPAPYKVNNSPLDPQGGDFPCKKTYTGATGTNSIPVGTPQTLSFTGGATHGGGSCQIALTSEPQPSASTKWQVIHSIMGGCPTNTTDGNLSETNADMVDPSTFQYTVPSDFAPGTYTLGVTWFNRVGNREMYMFCAPVTLTGGSKKKRGVEVRKEASRGKDGWFNKRANYPDLFKANIGPAGSGCGTVSSTDLIFPDPGDSIEYDRAGGSANPSLKGPTACASPTVAPGAAPSAGGSGSAGSSGAPVSSLAPATTTAAASAAATTAAASGSADPTDECSAMSGEASETGSASAASPTAVTAGGGSAAASVVPVPTAAGSASAVATPVASAAPSVAPSAAPSGSAGSTGSTSGGLTGACTSEGMFNCMGGTSYQQCASGMWSPVQPMAAGTSCKVGQSTGLWAVA